MLAYCRYEDSGYPWHPEDWPEKRTLHLLVASIMEESIHDWANRGLRDGPWSQLPFHSLTIIEKGLSRAFDTDGEVIFVEEKPADKPALQGYTAPPSCLYPTSPSVSLLMNPTVIQQNNSGFSG
jgi:hypothetical protein